MAHRLFRCHAITTNGIALGGVSTLGVAASYRTITRAPAEGSIGTTDVDKTGLRVATRLSSFDVTKVNAILAAAVGNTVFSAKESGAATFSNYTLGDSGIVWTGFGFSAREDTDAVLNLDGVIRASAAAKDISDMILLTSGAAEAGTVTQSTRLFRPKSASFDPTGADPAISPLKLLGIDMSLAALTLEEGLEDDVSMTAVDIQEWGPLVVALVFRDATGVSGTDRAVNLLQQTIGELTVDFKVRGGAADKTLTIKGLNWIGGPETNHQQGWSDYTLRGEAQWREDATDYQLNSATKLFAFA